MRSPVILIVGVGLLVSACSATTDAQVSTSESVASTTETETLTVHIGQLTGSTSNLGNTWTANVIITVVDASDQPIADAVVSGSCDQGDDVDHTCETDINGECSLISASIRKNIKQATLAINAVEHPESTYVADEDHDPDSITEGTSIRIPKT